jgi:phage terminase small subunit
MPVLTNPRHEQFAQALAKGKSATEAYALAGYKAHQPSASRLLSNAMVAARVEELQGRVAKKVDVTLESLAAELDEARSLAQAEKQPGAMVQATMGKAKLFGKIVDKHKHSGAVGTYDLSRMTDEQLDHLESILGPLALAGGDQGGEAEEGG